MMNKHLMPKERPKAREKIEELMKQGNSLASIFHKSNIERHLPAKERKYTVDVRKQAFRMSIEELDALKQKLLSRGWIKLPDGSLCHPDDKETQDAYKYRK